MRERIRKMGLKQKTVLLVMLFFAAAVLMSSLTFFSIYENMRKETIEKAMDNVILQKQEEIEGYFDSLETLAYSAGYSTWMQRLFQRKSIDTRTMQEVDDSVKDFLSSIADMNGGVKLSAIMDDGVRLNGSEGCLDYSVDLKEEEWYEDFLKQGKYMEEGEGKRLFTKDEGWYLNLFYPINNQYTMEPEGILAITIPQAVILNLSEMGVAGEYMVLKNGNGEAIADKIPEKIKKGIDKGLPCYNVRTQELDIGGEIWVMDVVLDTTSLVVDSRNIWIGFTMVLVLAAALFVVAAVLFSRYLTVPILKCRDAMIKIRNNHMGINLENPYRDELGELIAGFNEMSDSIYGLIEKNKTISMIQKETEYQMLLQQINPHFLYNTLEIINGLILGGKEKDAVSVCETLGQIFHYNLNQDKWIEVKDELSYIKRYLLVMKYKIPELSVYYDIDERVEGQKILKAILQPLIENCIRHGFDQRTRECCISITMAKLGEGLDLDIMDNGSGISREKYLSLIKELQEIRENPNQRKESSAHIGIWNVFHRLYLEYGEGMDFNIIAKENYGTKIQIRLPGGKEYV